MQLCRSHGLLYLQAIVPLSNAEILAASSSTYISTTINEVRSWHTSKGRVLIITQLLNNFSHMYAMEVWIHGESSYSHL